jgi:hypothetical protein
VLELNTTCTYDGTDCVCEVVAGGLSWNCGGGAGTTCPDSELVDGESCTVQQLNAECSYDGTTCTCGIGIGGLSWTCG